MVILELSSIDLDSQSLTILVHQMRLRHLCLGQTITVGLPDNVSVFNNLTVGGNITIGGTLTYEDVTNVDSVGIVTSKIWCHRQWRRYWTECHRGWLELLVLPHPLVDSSVT